MTAVDVLDELASLGITATASGQKLLLATGSRVPQELLVEVKENKNELLVLVSTSDTSSTLLTEPTEPPFPIGYGGLPRAQVEAAEAVMNRFGVTDPVLRKYNVISWVRGYYQDRGENQGEHYEALKAEQLRLGRILDPCGDPGKPGTD